MSLILAGYLAAALLVWLVAAAARKRPLSLRWGLHDFLTAVLVPGAGLITGALGLVLELVFVRSVRRGGADDLFRRVPEDALADRVPDAIEKLRSGTAVAPFGETLAAGEPEEIDRSLRRLSRSDAPSAVERLKEALRSPRRDVRVRARGLLVRLEDDLVRVIQKSKDPLERGRACRRLASLSVDVETAKQYLERASVEFRSAATASATSNARLELAKTLLELGDAATARDMAEWYLVRHPADVDAYRTRLKAHLILRDLPAIRRDCAALAAADPRYIELAQRWGGPAPSERNAPRRGGGGA
jgi:hypothetical protein